MTEKILGLIHIGLSVLLGLLYLIKLIFDAH
jgi:hypothetical protein